MSSLFNKRPKTNHEKKLALISARFREKPKKYPDPFETKKFLLLHIGQSGVSKTNASGLGGVHKILLEYYINFLKKITENGLSLRDYGKFSPSSIRMLTLSKGTMVVNFKQHRRPPADAMLIDQEQIYVDDQIIYSDCFCFEVVQPTGPNQTHDNQDTCYGYFRQASDIRRSVPESSLFLLDSSLSDFFLHNKHYPRPPIIVCVLGPSRNCSNYYCHVYVTETVEHGLDFVKTVVDYTYGMNENPMVKSTPNLSKLPYINKTDGPLRNLQRRVSKVPSKPLVSTSPSHFKMPSFAPSLAPLSGKNGRSMLFAPNKGVITNESINLSQEALDEIDRNFHRAQDSEISDHEEENDDERKKERSNNRKLDVYGAGPWLAKSTPALIVSPMSTDEFEPLRKRLLDMQIAQEARVERSRSKKSQYKSRPSFSRNRRSTSRPENNPDDCNCPQCEVHNYRGEDFTFKDYDKSPTVNSQETYRMRKSRYFPSKR